MTTDLYPAARDLLAKLVSFDTTSRGSNLPLIEWVEGYLDGLGAPHRRVPNADGTKSNLMATLGPSVEGGAVLSGHTDVVPVDGQPWSTDPFGLVEKDGRLYGRGTCDMKGFLALALAAAPELAKTARKPVHLAFSYDEEIGCLGAPHMIEVIRRELPAPAVVVVGEPTNMEAVNGHKGIATFHVTVTGREAHSSQPHQGVSAVMEAVKLMGSLNALAKRLEAEADPASPFTPRWPTLTIGMVHGGTAHNIIARECRFVFDVRSPGPKTPQEIVAGFIAEAQAMDAALKARAPEAGVAVELKTDVPPFMPERDGAAEAFARRMAGDNGPPRVVAFAAEAGQFQQAGFSTVICGPGSIDQAHQPDEYVEVSQMQRGAAFMRRLIEWASEG
ncbi:acetylornithine deacetylase [Phenylobacterium sp.]|uniref:acetylornithine deacetylase n=1 Tax=Phenylobacterium sp. TaxID=1871053 RepID=UPI0025D7A598|nr:acetylornithine deacetylase [Phenylobacterium sp.]MBX3481924.1 acetylornithine deacetylase [Phenylobacterium sp.]MCW5758596.1 acetylornithine deacetylase [Phenylobacterium sp.]